MSTHNIRFNINIRKALSKLSLTISYLELCENFLETQEHVQNSHCKLAIGIRDIEISQYYIV